jgi:hypothetical protein
MVDIMKQIDLKRDNCLHWHFYADWIPYKELAVWQPGNKWNATAKNRLSFASRSGYIGYHALWKEWNQCRQDIYEINTSAPVRQGNPMKPAYLEFPPDKNIVNTCEHHRYELVFVRKGSKVVAYAITHISGELMNISTILGHADYLKDGIMLSLMDQIQKLAILHGIKALTYYMWDSGTPGLQYHKHSVGFQPCYLSER